MTSIPAASDTLFHDEGFNHEDPWDYYAVAANFPLDLFTEKLVDNAITREKMKRYSIQEVFEHHQKRGNAENFIKEEKYAYDLKHFPCLKLNANYAY